ncbi:MAG: isoprenyl transferase [Candidatus Omnitrophota bacterium]
MTKSNIPRHVAIIMDGNGRWAHERKLPRYKGHEKGIEVVEHTIDGCLLLGIAYLTLYAFSIENWNRPKDEINVLMKYLSQYLDEKRDMLHKKKIRFNAIGRLELLSEAIQKKIQRNIEETKQYNDLVFTLALSYSGRSEIVDAVKKIGHAITENRISSDEIDEKLFAEHLSTKDIPDPDLLIRTSGEQRISNFLLWQLSYSELYFTDKCWPDFTHVDLVQAVEEYKKRNRRFGDVT